MQKSSRILEYLDNGPVYRQLIDLRFDIFGKIFSSTLAVFYCYFLSTVIRLRFETDPYLIQSTLIKDGDFLKGIIFRLEGRKQRREKSDVVFGHFNVGNR